MSTLPIEVLNIDGGGESSPAAAELPSGASAQVGDFVRYGEQTWRVSALLSEPGSVAGGVQVQVERLE